MEHNPYGLIALWQQGDWIIRAVALILAGMSIAAWSVIVLRSVSFFRLRRAISDSQAFWHAQDFTEGLAILGTPEHSPFRQLADEAQSAVQHHSQHQQDLHGQIPMTDWLTACLRACIDDNAERLQRGLSVLASIGSTAPFVGLFGTVWGIYHALIGIGVGGQASIDRVAGPVGEALIMTAFGLAVAIPAVLAYNGIQRSNRTLTKRLQRFAHQLHAYFLTGAAPMRPTYTSIPARTAR